MESLMNTRHSLLSATLVILAPATLFAADAARPTAAAPEPVLRLEAGGPTSYVNALALSDGGRALYAAGFDKVVRVWTLQDGKFNLSPMSYRIPLGPGASGLINAIALSRDNRWLAVAGDGAFTGRAGFRESGFIVPSPALTNDQRLEQGTVWVFDTRTQAARPLRGHRGPVTALAFAPTGPALLVSAGKESEQGSDSPKQITGVIRLWDLTKPDDQARVPEWRIPRIDPRRPVPTLAPWYAGPQKGVRVAVTWSDGILRVLQPGREDPQELGGDAKNPYYTVAFLPGRGALLTGGFVDQKGSRLQWWQIDNDGVPTAAESVPIPGGAEEGEFVLPWMIVPNSSHGNGECDRAAVILRITNRKMRLDSYRLALLDLERDHLGEVRANIPLWKSGGVQTMAGALRGAHVAVAGNPKHQIAVFSLADPLDDNSQPSILSSQGLPLHSVAFATQEKTEGLLIEAQPPGAGDTDRFVFALAERRLVSAGGWDRQVPDLKGWEAVREGSEGDTAASWSIIVRDPDGALKARIRFKPQHEYDAHALLPPCPPFNVPLLAVAHNSLGVPTLAIYHAATGDMLRVYSGHVAPITSLAFHADRLLLASTAKDQTACVWSLTDLDQIIGRHGSLPGLMMQDNRGGGVSVSAIESDSPAAKVLKAGDVIDGFVLSGQFKPVISAIRFYGELASRKPGDEVILRIHGGEDVRVRLGQAADERKPLMSLFVTRAPELEQRGWIGWSPSGPYDASGPRAERLVGWHLNTGRLTMPATFVPTDRYRKEYYRRGILERLIARGSLAHALADLQPPLPPAPHFDIRIDPAAPDQEKVEGRAFVRQPPSRLHVWITNEFPPDLIGNLKWRLDDSHPRALHRDSDREWSADLSGITWSRGPHRLEVTLEGTGELSRRTYSEGLALHYQPKKPVITLQGLLAGATGDATRSLVREQSEFPLQAKVNSAADAGPVIVTVIHRRPKMRVPDQHWEDGPVIDRRLRLSPDDNVIEIVARNRDALRGHEDLETERRAVVVFYAHKDAPPRISLAQVQPGRAGAKPEPVLPGRPVIVRDPDVLLVGEIQAEADISQAQWFGDLTDQGKSLTGFSAPKRIVAISERLPKLKRGKQSFRFLARAGTSEKAEATLVIEYQPRLPRLLPLDVEPGRELVEGKNPPQVTVRALLVDEGYQAKYQAAIRVNGQDVPVQPTIDQATQILMARLDLPTPLRRDYLIQLRISENDWGETQVAEIPITYRRPPRIAGVDVPAASVRSPVGLTAWVESPADVPVTDAGMRLERLDAGIGESVREVRRKADELLLDKTTNGTSRWKVSLRAVDLEAGNYAVHVWAASADGPCAEGDAPRVAILADQPPTIEIITPGALGKQVAEPEYQLTLKIHTDSPLERLEVRRDTEAVLRERPENLAGQDIELKPVVQLRPGTNSLQVIAVNRRGTSIQRIPTLSYTQPPVLLTVDRLEGRGAADSPPMESGEDCRGVFPQVADGRLNLHGHIEFANPHDPLLAKQGTKVRIWVNGFQQMPVDLDQPLAERPAERRFEAGILLNQERDNLIELALADGSVKSGQTGLWKVRYCRKPYRLQRLHLLVVDAGNMELEQLRDAAIKAIGAKKQGDLLVTPAFADVKLYGPLTGGQAELGNINGQLRMIGTRIRSAHEAQGPVQINDVIMVYYQGAEHVTREGSQYFLSHTSYRLRGGPRPHDPEGMDLSSKWLRDVFEDTPAAQVFLLDVARDGGPLRAEGDQIAQVPDNVRMGVLRYQRQAGGANPTPPPGPLMTTLCEVLPRSDQLKQVRDNLGADFSGRGESALRASRTIPGLLYDPHVPASLLTLVIGPARP